MEGRDAMELEIARRFPEVASMLNLHGEQITLTRPTEFQDKMEKDLKQLQAYVVEELNQRERAVRQLRRLNEEAAQEQGEQESQARWQLLQPPLKPQQVMEKVWCQDVLLPFRQRQPKMINWQP